MHWRCFQAVHRWATFSGLQARAAIAALVMAGCALPSARPTPFTASPTREAMCWRIPGSRRMALGRVLPGFKECGPVKKDKWVGIFYWTWHTPRAGRTTTPSSWPPRKTASLPGRPTAQPHHWGEPELGYYQMTDPFVIRKHASLLVDAGIDVVLFDTTNPPYDLEGAIRGAVPGIHGHAAAGRAHAGHRVYRSVWGSAAGDRPALARPLRTGPVEGPLVPLGRQAAVAGGQGSSSRTPDAGLLHLPPADAGLLDRAERAGPMELAGGLSAARLHEPPGRGGTNERGGGPECLAPHARPGADERQSRRDGPKLARRPRRPHARARWTWA